MKDINKKKPCETSCSLFVCTDTCMVKNFKNRFFNIKILHFALLACFVCSVSILTAQVGIEGSVVDEDGKSVNGYSIIVLNGIDSSMQTTKQFSTDKFSMEIPSLQCIVKISSLGFNEAFAPLPQNTGSDKINLGTTVLFRISQNLDEVVITGKKPFMTMLGEKLIYNIENTTVSNSGTAIDLLRRTPKIIVDKEDNVSIAGKEKIMILINGRKVRNNTELQTLNSAQIKQVEIIENPSAKYEADGHAVINIVLRKNTDTGLAGSVYLGHRQGRAGTQFLNPEISYMVDKLRVWGNFGTELSRKHTGGDDLIKYEKENYLFKSYSYALYSKRKTTNFSYSTGVEYNFNPSNLLSVYWDGYLSRVSRKSMFNLEIEKNNLVYPTLQTEYNTNGDPLQNSVGINYSHTGKSGSKISFMSDVTSSGSPDDKKISDTNLTSLHVSKIHSSTDAKYNVVSAQIDVEIPVSESGKTEFGGKISSVNNKHDFLFERLGADNQWLPVTEFTNTTGYSEQIFGLYAIQSGKIKKWQYSAGLRVENTWIENLSDNKIIDKKNYLRFFPNISLTLPTDNMTYRLSYRHGISRPDYSIMNNMVVYNDTLSVYRGNPFLQPMFYNTASFNLMYRQKITASLSYSYIENPLTKLFVNDKENIERYTAFHTNLQSTWSVSMGLSGNFSFGKFSTQPSAWFFYRPMRIIDDDVLYTFRHPAYGIRYDSQLELPKNYTIDAAISLQKPGGHYQKYNERLDFDLGCTKKMLKNRLILKGSIMYITKIWIEEYKYSYKYYIGTYLTNEHGLSFSVSARFYLNDNAKQIKKNKKSSEDEINRF